MNILEAFKNRADCTSEITFDVPFVYEDGEIRDRKESEPAQIVLTVTKLAQGQITAANNEALSIAESVFPTADKMVVISSLAYNSAYSEILCKMLKNNATRIVLDGEEGVPEQHVPIIIDNLKFLEQSSLVNAYTQAVDAMQKKTSLNGIGSKSSTSEGHLGTGQGLVTERIN